MSLKSQIPVSWQAALELEFAKPYIAKLEAFLESERKAHQVFPPESEVFSALEFTPFDAVRVLIVGQDPYHDDGQAHGLAFSVQRGIKVPPSLVNMYKELESDLGVPRAKHGFLESWARQGVLMLNTVLTVRAHEPASHKKRGWEDFTDAIIKVPPSLVNMYKELESDLGVPRAKHGFLESWARQGVLMLNTVLTVRAHEPASHKKRGWEDFTDAIIKAVSAKEEPVVFVLWGAHAQKKLELIDSAKHTVIQSAHPSPLSAKAGFFGSKPFSKINATLKDPIDWSLE